ncbi:MAG TPA: hypothetical protein VIR00_05830 [Micromonosporaceae bacterium]
MTTPDPNQNPYDPRSQPGPQDPSNQPGGPPYADPSPYAGGDSEPTVPPGEPSTLPTWPQQPDGSAYPQYGYGQVPPYPGGQNPGPQYPGQQYPGQQYPGQQYPGQQYPGQQYPGQPYPDPYPSGPYGAGTPYGGQIGYPADPLVPHPGGGFGAWWNTLWSAFARSWKQLLPIVALTSALPGILLTIVSVESLSRSFTAVDDGDIYTNDVTVHWGTLGAFVGLGVVLGIVSLFASAIGWSGAMWLVTRQAAGAPASVGEALAFGARRCLRLGGLLVVVGLMVVVGLVACFLPGLYLAIAASLVVPFAIFDRGTGAISGSFRLVNRNFGAVLGRLVIMYLLVGAVSGVVNLIVSSIVGGSMTNATANASPSAGAIVGEAVFSAIVAVPTTMFLIIGILMTYSQMRARAVPTTAHDLVNSLGA